MGFQPEQWPALATSEELTALQEQVSAALLRLATLEAALDDKANKGHNHNGRYALSEHTHGVVEPDPDPDPEPDPDPVDPLDLPELSKTYVPADLVTVRPGTGNHRAAIQTVLDAGGRVRIEGVHTCDGPLLVEPGAVIYVAEGGRLLKNFSRSGTQRNAFIQNKNWSRNGADRVWVGGPGEIGAVNQSQTGNIVSLFGDHIRLAGFKTTAWNGGRHTVLAGDHIRARWLDWRGGTGSTGNGGLRFQGGDDFICGDSYCSSGDDVWQFVPAGAEADPNYGMAITNSYYIRCNGYSSHAKLVVIGLQFGGTAGAPDGEVTMPASSFVKNCGFIDCHAPDGSAVTSRIQNISGAGSIEDCYIRNVSSKGIDTPTGQAELFINAWEDTGGIARLTIEGLVMDPDRQAVAIQRGGVDISFENCLFRRGLSATGNPVASISGTRTRVKNCTFDGMGKDAPVVEVGAPASGGGPLPSDIVFDTVKFLNIGRIGVSITAGTGLAFERCIFRGSGVAIQRSGGTAPRLVDNDYGSLTPPSAA